MALKPGLLLLADLLDLIDYSIKLAVSKLLLGSLGGVLREHRVLPEFVSLVAFLLGFDVILDSWWAG